MTSSNLYYEYKIRSGDTFSGIIHYMFGYTQGATRYAETAQYLLALGGTAARQPTHHSKANHTPSVYRGACA